jgi:N-acyl-D-aspartate/D-glutamate deacylase
MRDTVIRGGIVVAGTGEPEIPQVRDDLSMNGRRWVHEYRNTFVSGASTFENGVYTGAMPGRLVRACVV